MNTMRLPIIAVLIAAWAADARSARPSHEEIAAKKARPAAQARSDGASRRAAWSGEPGRAERLQKYDLLLSMATDTGTMTPALEDAVTSLKAKEAALLDVNFDERPPAPPRLGNFGGGGDDAEESGALFEEAMTTAAMDALEEAMDAAAAAKGAGADADADVDADAARDANGAAAAAAASAKVAALRGMTAEERIAAMKADRDERLRGRAAAEAAHAAMRETLGLAAGKPGGPSPFHSLAPEDRRSAIAEHTAAMEAHREEMAEWRERHAAHVADRRAINDEYRALSRRVRDAAIEARPLR